MSRSSSVALFALAGLVALAGCGRPAPPREVREGPNALVVVLDACRADKLGTYGYERRTSPAIDAIAAEPDAVVFERHYVQGSWTKPSTASLFTGQFVHHHGVRQGHEPKPGAEGAIFGTQILSDGATTLAERLDEAGLYTFAVVKSRHLAPRYGFSQGFDAYVPAEDAGDDEERVERTLDLIAEAPGPFFGYVHLNACHFPFPEDRRDPEILDAHPLSYDEAARREEGIDFTTSELKHAIRDGRIRLTPDDVVYLHLLYDSKLRHTDRRLVAPLVDGLRELGVWDDLLLVVTADHGEELYEHEGYAHGHAVWDEVVRVPLIVKFPRGGRPQSLPARVASPTQAVDLYPSLLSYFEAPVPETLPGSPILAGRLGRYAFSESEETFMIATPDWKLIDSPAGALLFAWPDDRDERRNRAEDEERTVAELRRSAEALREAFPRGEAPTIEDELEPEALEALRSLGYLR